MKIKRWLGIAILSCVALAPFGVNAQAPQVKRLAAPEAKGHIGERATVCGKVASTRYAATTRGKPTFLNLDQPYPNPLFTVLTHVQHLKRRTARFPARLNEHIQES